MLVHVFPQTKALQAPDSSLVLDAEYAAIHAADLLISNGSAQPLQLPFPTTHDRKLKKNTNTKPLTTSFAPLSKGNLRPESGCCGGC
jgi:hypothetical protein